jgi:hypothetical protein
MFQISGYVSPMTEFLCLGGLFKDSADVIQSRVTGKGNN